MDRFTGWTRGTMVAALMVLSTGACAQRVSTPAPVAAQPPVAQVQPVAPVAQAAPVQAAPAQAEPVARTPLVKPSAPAAKVPDVKVADLKVPAAKAPAPIVSEPKAPEPKPLPTPVAKVAAPTPPKPVAQKIAPPELETPEPKTPELKTVAEAPAPERSFDLPPVKLPEEPVAREVVEAPLPEKPAKKGLFDFLLGKAPAEEAPATQSVSLRQPASLGAQYQVAEVASADYGSTVERNPTPDAAPDIAELTASDEPAEPPAGQPAPAQTPPTYRSVALDEPSAAAPEPEVADTPEAPEPAYEPVSAFASLFGGGEPDEEPEAVEEEEPAPATPLAANVLTPADDAPEDNPYPGGFADDEAYETAQLAQPNYGYNAPPPAFNPNAPVTVAILTPDSDSRPSIRTLAKGLSQAAALSARALGDRQLVLRGYDTGGSPNKARQAAQQAVSDGAQLIIGPLFSSSAAAVAPVAQSAGVPVIAFTTDESVLRRGVYSVGYLPDAEVDRMLSYAAKRGIRKIGLLSPDTPYGGIVYRTVQNTAAGYGVNVATVQPISPNFAQAAETGKRFAEFYETNPDVQGVLIATNGKALQGIAAYLAYNDVLPSKVQYMGLGIWDDAETFREATLRGGWFPGLDPALKTAFEGRYSGAYGSKPPAVAALAYDGVAIAGALLARAKSTGQPPFTIQNIENPTGFRGMSGLFRFLPSGRNQRLLSILKVGRRQFEMVDPAPTTFGQRLTSITGYRQ